MPEFRPWPKIARLNRDIIITEKIDGTNAAVYIPDPLDIEGEVYAQSRTRIITPGKHTDNAGFAGWVKYHEDELRVLLGPGLHFGEWWGNGIQRGYGLAGKRFSLFNVRRFGYLNEIAPPELGIGTVPVLYEGPFGWPAGLRDPWIVVMEYLRNVGSLAAPGFMRPEGIVIFHTAASTMFKVTLEGDEKPKGSKE